MANRSTGDFEKNANNRAAGVNKIMNFLLAVAFVGVGIVCLIKYKDDTTMMALGVVAIIYGLWKGYKGFRSN